jgi:hypothetical protein
VLAPVLARLRSAALARPGEWRRAQVGTVTLGWRVGAGGMEDVAWRCRHLRPNGMVVETLEDAMPRGVRRVSHAIEAEARTLRMVVRMEVEDEAA